MSALRRSNPYNPNDNGNIIENDNDCEVRRRSDDLLNARRHGHGRISFLRAGRAANIAAVVRSRAPLPAHIIHPATDASQLNQWDQYRHPDASPLNQRTLQSNGIEDRNVASHFPATIAELDAPKHQHEMDGDNAGNEVSRLHSPVSPQSHSSDGQWALSRSISGAPTQEESSWSQDQQPSALSAAPHALAEAPSGLPCEVLTGFDCPIRAGPNGKKYCSWRPPKDNLNGFPKIPRVKEHVGGHGLLCPDCDRVFTVPTRYKDHRKDKVSIGICNATGLYKKDFPYSIALPPSIIEEFFKRPSKTTKSDHEIWLDGYKILHPDWQGATFLPSPSYRQNMNRERPDQFAESSNGVVNQSQGIPSTTTIYTGQGVEKASESICATSQSVIGHNQGQEMPSQATVGNVNTDFGHQSNNIEPNLFAEMDLSQTMDDLAWINGLYDGPQDPGPSGSGLVSPLFEMAGALPDPTSRFESHEQNHTIDGAGDQDATDDRQNVLNNTTMSMQSEGHQTSYLQEQNATESEPVSAPTTNGGGSHNPYRQQGTNGDFGSVMEVDGPTSPPARQEMRLSEPSSGPTSSSVGKRSARMSTPNALARKNALRQIKKLTSEAVELLSKMEALHTENRDLHAKLGETEREKQKLLLTLRQIQGEIDIWEFDDEEVSDLQERIDMLNQSMQNIRELLPP